jgi:hypothetical protein
MSWFRKRRPILNHLQAARQQAEGAWPTGPRTYLGEVERLATASPDEVRSAIDAALAAREAGWQEIQESAEAARAQAKKSRAGVRGDQPRKEPAPEPVSVDPDLRPKYTRAAHDKAEAAAAIATRYLLDQQLEARRRRLGGDAPSLDQLTDIARQQAAAAGRFSDTGATQAVVAFLENLGGES